MTTQRLRAGDADRQQAVDQLAGHYSAGRLTTSEYDERVAGAFRATYLDELPVLFADLPVVGNGDAFFGQRRGTRAADARRFATPFDYPAAGQVMRGRPPLLVIAVVAMVAFVALGVIGMLLHVLFSFPVLAIIALVLVLRGRRRRHWAAQRSRSSWEQGGAPWDRPFDRRYTPAA